MGVRDSAVSISLEPLSKWRGGAPFPLLHQQQPLSLLLLLLLLCQGSLFGITTGLSLAGSCRNGAPQKGAPSLAFLLPSAPTLKTLAAPAAAAPAVIAALGYKYGGEARQEGPQGPEYGDFDERDSDTSWQQHEQQTQQEQEQQGTWGDWRRGGGWQRPWRPRRQWDSGAPLQQQHPLNQQQQQHQRQQNPMTQYGGAPNEGLNSWRGPRWRGRRAPAAGGIYDHGPRERPFGIYEHQQQQGWRRSPSVNPAAAATAFDSLGTGRGIDVGLLQHRHHDLYQQMEAVLPLSLSPEDLADLVEGTRRQHLLQLERNEGPPPLLTSLPPTTDAVAPAAPLDDDALGAHASAPAPVGTWWFPLSSSFNAAFEKYAGDGPEAQQQQQLLQHNLLLLQQEAHQRSRRRQILDEALGRHGLDIHPSSWLCRSFVFLRRTPIRNVIFSLWRHKILDDFYQPLQQQTQQYEGQEDREQQREGRGRGLAALEEDWRKHLLWTSGIDIEAHPILETSLLLRKEAFYQRRYLAVMRRHPSARFVFIPQQSSSNNSSSERQQQMFLPLRSGRPRGYPTARAAADSGKESQPQQQNLRFHEEDPQQEEQHEALPPAAEEEAAPNGALSARAAAEEDESSVTERRRSRRSRKPQQQEGAPFRALSSDDSAGESSIDEVEAQETLGSGPLPAMEAGEEQTQEMTEETSG